MTGQCWYPEDPEDGSSPPEGFDEWRDPSGLCEHEHCAEGNRIGRLYASSRRAAGMTRDEIEALRNDHELIRDEFHGQWTQDHGGYVLVADEGD